MDNDLPITDCSPGFGSAAKYVATAVREAAFDLTAMSRTSTKVFTVEVGRHAGWTTAASALAAEHEGDAPHILLLPEIAFDEGRFLAKVEEALARHDQCVIAVSEGLKGSDGEFLSATGTTDTFGHAQLGGVAPLISNLIGGKLGCKCHWAVPDYFLRSARHIASGTDLEQAYAVGRAAVEFAVAGKNAVMPAIRRLSDAPYRWDIIAAPLSEVANQEKLLPAEFISADGSGVTEAARRYLAPLIVGEAYPPFRLRYANAYDGIAQFGAKLTDLVRSILGVSASIVEEEPDVVCSEYFEQAFILRAMLVYRANLVAAGSECRAWCVTERGNRLFGSEAGVDEVFGQRPDDAVAPGINSADLLRVLPCVLQHPAGGGIDHGSNAARLGIEGIFSGHNYPLSALVFLKHTPTCSLATSASEKPVLQDEIQSAE
jgi:hypothetical protein